MQKIMPIYHIEGQKHPAWDPDWDVLRFSCLLVCTVDDCGEVVSVGGDITRSMGTADDVSEWADWYAPKFMYPGSPLVEIPLETPEKVKEVLKSSFSLFWSDRGSCASKIRLSVERILDAFEVDSGNLSSRISSLRERYPDYADTFEALRFLGNVGTHEGDVGREEILDAYEIYQDQLADMFGGRRVRLKELTGRLITSRGKYREF